MISVTNGMFLNVEFLYLGKRQALPDKDCNIWVSPGYEVQNQFTRWKLSTSGPGNHCKSNQAIKLT